MAQGYFEAIHPVLPVRNVITSLQFYVEKLGFDIAFGGTQRVPEYAGVKRDNIEIHLQLHSSEEWKQMSASSLRFVIQNIEGLYEEYSKTDVFHKSTALRETTWNTKEFAFYDPDMNGLTFYRDM